MVKGRSIKAFAWGVARMKQKRSNIEIIGEMLRVAAHSSAGKTQVMHSANMSPYQFQKYLGFLLGCGLIDCLTAENSHFQYQVTKKGGELLNIIDSVLQDVESKMAVDP